MKKIKKLKYDWKRAMFDVYWDLEVEKKINEIINVLNNSTPPKTRKKE